MIRSNELSLSGVARVVVVLTMFLVVPVGVWWVAMPLISDLPLSDSVRRLLTFAVLGTLAFGVASAFLVLKGMADEP